MTGGLDARPAPAAESARLFRRDAIDGAGPRLHGAIAHTRAPRLAVSAVTVVAAACACAAFTATLHGFATASAPLTRAAGDCAAGHAVAIADMSRRASTTHDTPSPHVEHWSAALPWPANAPASALESAAWHVRASWPATARIGSMAVVEACRVRLAGDGSGARLVLRFDVRGAPDIDPEGSVVAVWRETGTR